MSKKLVWILAGGATVVVLGGAAIWWWRRRKQKAAKSNGEQPPTPEPDEADEASPNTETAPEPADAPKAPKPAFLARDELGLFTQASASQAGAAPRIEDAAKLGKDEHGLFKPLRAEAVRGNTRRRDSSEPAAEVVTAVVMTPAPIVEITNSEPATEAAEPEPEPPTVLVPKRRRKRYPVGPGQVVELRPDRVGGLVSWSASRPDVEIRVLEQDDSRALLALDGPVGEVNVALLCDGPKGPRPITSWKFEIVDKVA